MTRCPSRLRSEPGRTRALRNGGAGANLRVTQELMRHASPATTAVYTQVTDEERRRAVLSLAA